MVLQNKQLVANQQEICGLERLIEGRFVRAKGNLLNGKIEVLSQYNNIKYRIFPL
jgi:hypothetical protein